MNIVVRNRGGLQTLRKPHSGSFPDRIPYSALEPFRQYLREQCYRESTIITKTKLISFLLKRVNLWDQEDVKAFIKGHQWNGKRKNNASYAYRNWCKMQGFDFKVEKVPEPDAPLPYIEDGAPRIEGKKTKVWYGIELKWNDVSTPELENSITEKEGRKGYSIVPTVPSRPLLDDFIPSE